MNRLFDLLSRLVAVETEAEAPSEQTLATAAACLLIEVARSDTRQDNFEIEAIRKILETRFAVDEAMTEELMAAAGSRVEEANDLYQFTSVINDAFSYQQKELLLYAMWLVAFADGELAAIEDHIIRRIAGLLHLPHEDFIRLKLRAKRESESG